MSNENDRAKAVFGEALDIESPKERLAYLDQSCGDDAELRAEVEELLRAIDQAGSFMARPVFESPATLDAPPIAERAGSMIGRYKLLEEIGEGGFGVVFMAEQREPVRRKVALKIIKPGMDTRQVIGRFEAERQALAMMDHPNIAHVFDGGATESGRPYFVMELVRGMRITKYCDEAKLTTDERLRLVISVCDAVQHAHQKGIIHRDIKPRNVLVTLHGETPVPKIIDFGVAKATQGQLTEKTVFTGFGQMIGTPAYMSPEQVALSGLDVDTRSDIYSLGVLLYELLSGVPPFDKDRFREASYDEIRDVIREEEPPRPSSRFSTLAAEATSTITANRKTDTSRLRHSLRGELDWIVMKALEKDRTRRYESANELAKDVQRYLDGEAVEACPPSAWYRLRKYAKRRKGLLTTAALLAATMLVATGVSVSFAIQANAEKDKAVAAQELADKRLAQSRLDFERALKALDTVVEELSSEEVAQIPDVEKIRSEVLERILELYEAIAEEHGDDPYARQQQAIAYGRIASILRLSRQLEESLIAINQGVSILEELLEASPGDRGLKLQLSNLLFNRLHLMQVRPREERLKDAQKALALREELVEPGSNKHIYMVSLLHLKVAHFLPEDSPHIDEHISDSIRVAEEHGIAPHIESYILLATRAARKGDTAVAERNYRRAIDRARPSVREQPPTERRLYCNYCSSFARLLASQGRFDEAKVLHLESIEVAQQLYREYGKVTWYGQCLDDSVRWYLQDAKTQQQKEEAAELLDKLIADFPEARSLHRTRAELLSGLAGAEARLSAAIEEFPRRAEYYLLRARVFDNQGDSQRVIADYEKGVAILESLVAEFPDQPDRAARLNSEYSVLGNLLRHVGRLEDAEKAYRKAIAISEKLTADVSANEYYWNQYFDSYGRLIKLLKSIGRTEEAEQILHGMESPPTAGAYSRRANLFGELGKFDGALADLNRAIELNSSDAGAYHLHALAQLGAEDIDGYRTACGQMLEQSSVSKEHPRVGWVTWWTFALAPDAVTDFSQVIPAAELLLRNAPQAFSQLRLLGAILYRAGRFEEALERLTEANNMIEEPDTESTLTPSYICIWYFLAMAHHKLGHDAEAEKWLDKATEWTDKVLGEHDEGKSPLSWNRRLTLKLLREEAEEMIGNEEG